jgi:putative SOS response-associated peptidase YedK
LCNLYTVRKSVDEVARHFGVLPPANLPNVPAEAYPGSPGLVVREQDGQRVVQSMTWGFPLRLSFMKPDSKPKPVNNIADLNKGMWKGLANKPQWRCLIPVTHFAEAEGPKGAKTRTWVNIKDQPIIAWGGLWRDSAEWGPVYSGAMTDANTAMSSLHNRMPVFLLPTEWDIWLRGSFDDLLALQARKFPDEPIEIERTSQLWVQKKTKPPAETVAARE